MQKKIIVHFGKFYSPDKGGIETVTASIATGSVKAGHFVTVVCFSKYLNCSPKGQFCSGVKVFRYKPLLILSSQPIGFQYFFKCIQLAHRSEIVHLHAPNMLAALCCLFLPKKVRLIVHWHSDVINKGILGFLFQPLEKFILKRAHSIIATSLNYASFSSALKKFLPKIKIIPIGIKDRPYSDESKTLPKHLEEFITNKKVILSVGRLVSYKGFSSLINAVKEINTDSVVVIVGDGPDKKKLLSLIENNLVSDRILLTGILSDEHLSTLFTRAYIYCLPSTTRAEAFGVVLLEAMSYGIPVVATEIEGSGVPWVNKHGVSGFNVLVNNSTSLADAINNIIYSQSLHDFLSRGARDRFMNSFTDEISTHRVLDIYQSDGNLS